MNNAKGNTLPPRKTEDAKNKFVESAPLKTSTDVQTNPEASLAPWRDDVEISHDELMVLTHKTTNNIPLELELRLQFLMRKKKPKGFGRRINRNDLLIEAVDSYTVSELKKLGYKV